MTYQEYEKKCDEIIIRNTVYLAEFREDLEKAGLKDKTIRRHCNNVKLYINTFLLREEPLEAMEGASSYRIDDFLGYFLIRKCMWSTPVSIKSSAASIKKFYESMRNRSRIEIEDYDDLILAIKEKIGEWMAACDDYNDSIAENPFA